MIQYHYIPGQTPLNEEEKRDLIPSIVTHRHFVVIGTTSQEASRRSIRHKSPAPIHSVKGIPPQQNPTMAEPPGE